MTTEPLPEDFEPAHFDFTPDPVTLVEGDRPMPELPDVLEAAPEASVIPVGDEPTEPDPYADLVLPEGADPRTQWRVATDGTIAFAVTLESLLYFLEHGVEMDPHGNIVATYYWNLHADGSLTISNDDYENEGGADPWPVGLMRWPGAAWIEMWDNDFQRAITEQLQPMIDNLPAYLKRVQDQAEA